MSVTRIARRPRMFYGWYIVALAFLAQFMSSGLQMYTLGVFIKPIIDELGWTRGGISSVVSAGTVVNGLMALFIGGTLDRRGGRGLMLFGAAVLGLGFAVLSLMQELWHFYLIRSALITLGALCMGNLVVNVAICNWFVRLRGRAVAIAAMGASFSGVTLVPLSQFLIDAFGWRNAWIALGLMVWVAMIPPTALIMKRRPEDAGLLPDGDSPDSPRPESAIAAQEATLAADVPWTRAEALRTSALWMILAAFGLSNLAPAAVATHLVPYVEDAGFSAVVAASALSVMAVFAMTSKLAWGFLIERFPVRYLAAVGFSISAVGLVLLMESRSIEMIYLSLTVLGVGFGCHMPTQEVVWANYFGRVSLGTVRSVGMPFMILSGAGGPLIPGIAYDLTRSYLLPFLAIAAALALAAVLVSLVRSPRPPQSATRFAVVPREPFLHP